MADGPNGPVKGKSNGVAARPVVAIVGGDTLLARELREILDNLKPSPRLQLIAGSLAEGQSANPVLTKDEEDVLVMLPLTPEILEGASVAFLAGSHASSRRTLKIASGLRLIDLTGALEDQPNAQLRAPLVESERPGTVPVEVIAHPAAIALASLLARVAKSFAIRSSIAHVIEPASERGQRGVDELQQQTVAVLSFQKLKTEVYDTQLAFSVLAQYGEEAIEPLSSIEERVQRNLAALLKSMPGIPIPSLRLIQGPVFHGHSFSLWIEFEKNPGAEAFSNALSAAGVDVRPDEAPSNVGIAGQSGLSVGAIAADPNNARALWLWMVADNLKLIAENAVAVAKETML